MKMMTFGLMLVASSAVASPIECFDLPMSVGDFKIGDMIIYSNPGASKKRKEVQENQGDTP